MKKNKLVIAVAAAALMSSMGALAANQDKFDINYISEEQITINVSRDVNLSDADSVDGSTTNVRGTTTFCVGRKAAASGNELGYTLAADSTNNGKLLHSNGINVLDYTLKYEVAANTLPAGNYASAEVIATNGVPVDNDLKTGIDLPACNAGSQKNGLIWVNIDDTNGAQATGEYTDTVTLTVAVK